MAAPQRTAAPRRRRPRRRSRSKPTSRTRRSSFQHAQDDRAPPDRIEAAVPHIYLTVDIQLDALLKLRGELNASLASRGVKLSVNDMLIKALALALIEVPECNVSFAGDTLIKYSRADISVAVSIPGGLITPIIADAEAKAISAITTEMHDLASRAKEGKLQPDEYQGGTAILPTWACSGSSISRR